MQAFSVEEPFFRDPPYNAAMPGRKPTREQPFFGKQLSSLRQKRGLTQQELADELGVTRELVGHYERRCENPSIEFIVKLATTMGVSTDELLGLKAGKDMPGPSPKALKLSERIGRLPKTKQAVVLEMLESWLDKAS